MQSRSTRRHFLMSAAALGAAGLGVRPSLALADKKPAPSERLRVGAIGIAGQGAGDLASIAAAGAEIVALCDVHEDRAEVVNYRKRFDKAKFYTDFRKMIDAGGLDAVMVATPDHTHAPATLAALRANLHAFCEKPLTHTVEEARLVAETAAKMKRVTQMGTQIHAGGNYRRVVELIQGGAIGPVREAHVWVGKDWGGGDRPKDTPPVPKGLHWDLWLGPVAERPYHPIYVPANWRRFWVFGGGTLNDMACHYMDLPFWALKLRHPTHVEAEGPKPHAETAARQLIVRYQFPERGSMPACKLNWYDGGKRPKQVTDGSLGIKWGGDGVLFVGDKGMLIADYGSYRLLPEEKFKGFTPPKQTIPNSIGHYKEWVEACKSNGPTTCNFDYSGALTESVLLGTVAYRLGKPFDWDGKTLKASEPDAERFLRKAYRKGWELGA
ncbi:MAG: Gfo/Idh/MocA family oxidoreductase [Gemmataceae bacterium]